MTTFVFDPTFADATKTQLFEQIRLWRNTELANCDWTQLSDAVCDKTAWVEYRQALRDLPAQNTDPKKIVFPTRPE